MLYHLFYPLHKVFSVFNIFKYITFRTAYSIITALIISFICGPMLIRELKKHQIGENIRKVTPLSHAAKSGTPTMGGILILSALVIPTVLWADITNRYVWIVLISTLCLGIIGFIDDYIKVVKNNAIGLRAMHKFISQILVGLGVGLTLYYGKSDFQYATSIGIPFFKDVLPDLGVFYIPFVTLVIVGASNAVNLTDGLDGLASGPVVIAAAAYMIIVYMTGHIRFAQYLNIIYVKGCGELTIFCGAVAGAGLGFLWFNTYPAEIFMGNMGSLSLGGAIGTVAVISKHELLLVAIGGIFVIETISVIMQVGYFKATGGKRIFRMAPLHHHFEEKGWDEPKIIVRFWIIAVILALLSLSTLKIR